MNIQTGSPTTDGIHACYIDNPVLPAYTERVLLMWFHGQWTYPRSDQKYRGRVYGWVVLPVMKKERFAAEYDL